MSIEQAGVGLGIVATLMAGAVAWMRATFATKEAVSRREQNLRHEFGEALGKTNELLAKVNDTMARLDERVALLIEGRIHIDGS